MGDKSRCLAISHPQIAKEWHSTKNGILTPNDVTEGSAKKVWWYLPYDDPITGEHFDFEWQETVCNRTRKNYGCPYLSGNAVWPGYNDLATKFPEIASEWNYARNGNLTPSEICSGSGKLVWWYLPYDDPITGEHFDFEWQASVNQRTRIKTGCPYLLGKKVWPGYNDLATKFPEIASEWNYTRNGKLVPSDIVWGSMKKVWWNLSYDDPITGEHFDFEWRARISDRAKKGSGCPYLSGHAVWSGYNDLATKYPEVASEWNYAKNGDLVPSEISWGSKKKVWWCLLYDDLVTGEHFCFEWQETVFNRTKNKLKCPFLSGQAVWPGYNDLTTKFPEIASEWNYAKNGDLVPSEISWGSNKKVWWYLSYDDPVTGKHFDFEWQASVNQRTRIKTGCPYLSGHAVWSGYNDLATKFSEIASEWNYAKNGDLIPSEISWVSKKKVWWYLPYDDPVTGKHFDFEWQETVFNRTKNKYKCPYLSEHAVWSGYNDLATKYPEIASEWNYTKNGDLVPSEIRWGCTKKVWWYLPYDDPVTGEHFDFEWQETVYNRTKNKFKCPYLSGKKAWPGYNDLATKYPEIASEWHKVKNRKLRPDMVMARSGKKVWWECDEGHEWKVYIYQRTLAGTGCPYCKTKG